MLKLVFKYGKKTYFITIFGWMFLVFLAVGILLIMFPKNENIYLLEYLEFAGILFILIPRYQSKHFFDDFYNKCDLQAFKKKANSFYKIIQYNQSGKNAVFILNINIMSAMFSDDYVKARELYNILQKTLITLISRTCLTI